MPGDITPRNGGTLLVRFVKGVAPRFCSENSVVFLAKATKHKM